MYRLAIGIIALCGVITSCGNNDGKDKQAGDSTKGVTGLRAVFKETSAPYQLTDTALLKITPLKEPPYDFSVILGDSVLQHYLGKYSEIRFTPLAYLTKDTKENFYIMQVAAGKKKAAFLMVYSADGRFTASTPFLLPDEDPNTVQTTAIDKSFTITKTTVKREGAETVGEGKEVIAYEPSTKSFSVIMMDALADHPAVLVNPIDTFPKTNKLSGDYILNKKNMVAVRDGRHANQLLVFIHTENESGDCIGQMKGEFIITSSTTAAYRQGGDPCVLNLIFKGATVSINEETGCGNYRGLDCKLSGTFTRKKVQTPKPASTKLQRK